MISFSDNPQSQKYEYCEVINSQKKTNTEKQKNKYNGDMEQSYTRASYASVLFDSPKYTAETEESVLLLLEHTCGCTIDPPAANEYAVLPDVVDKISPSPWTHVTKVLSQ